MDKSVQLPEAKFSKWDDHMALVFLLGLTGISFSLWASLFYWIHVHFVIDLKKVLIWAGISYVVFGMLFCFCLFLTFGTLFSHCEEEDEAK